MPETKRKETILKLNSPVSLSPVIYRWPLQSQEGYDEAHELIESIRWVCHDFPDLRVAVENYILDRIDLSDFDRTSQMCDRFNRAADNIRRLRSGMEPPKCIGAPPSRDLLKHIMVQVYNRSIPDPDKLNSYEPFSPEVYGESSYDLVADIITELKLTEDDIFLDLGSGVGNVVLQVAAAANCTCYGIEKNEIPARYAKEMEEEFLQWMDWYGKAFGDFELLQGDFLEADNHSYIKKSTVIFVNNFAFGPGLNHKLKEIFSGLADGTRIVTSLELAPLNFKVTPRTLSDLGSILRVSQLSATEGNVSWTDKPVSYYLHVIDRTKLEKYFQQQKRRGGRESPGVSEARPKRKRRKQTKKSGRRKRRATTSSEESVSLTPTDPSDFYLSSEDNEDVQDEMRASLDVLVESYRQQVTEFLDKMQTKEFKDQLIEQIQLEKERKSDYTEKIAEMEEKIREILNDGANSIRKVMTEFGIENQTPMGLTDGARAMLVQNRQLKEDTRVLEERVTKLEEEHKELLRDCKDSMGEEVFAPVANKLDMYLKCNDPKLIDWNSPLVHINPSLATSVVKPPSHPLTPLRKQMRDPKKKTIRLLKQKDKQNSSQISAQSVTTPPPVTQTDSVTTPVTQTDSVTAPVTQTDSVIEPMDTAQPLLPTSSTAPSEQTLEEIEVLSKPLLKQDQQRDISTITISSSPSPPRETSFSIKSITRPSREKAEKTTLIPSPTSSLAPPPPEDIPAPPELVSLRQQPVLTPHSSTYLHPFFTYLQNNPIYSQYLEKQGVPYPFYPIALPQPQIMSMYYSQLSPDTIATLPRPPGPLPHMPLTNFPLPTFSPELLAVRDSSRSKQKRSEKSKRRHHKDPNHTATPLETSMVPENTPSLPEIITPTKYKQENGPETGICTPINTPTLPDNT